MKYMLLIHQGDTPTPRDPDAWGRLSEAEQKAVMDQWMGWFGSFGASVVDRGGRDGRRVRSDGDVTRDG